MSCGECRLVVEGSGEVFGVGEYKGRLEEGMVRVGEESAEREEESESESEESEADEDGDVEMEEEWIRDKIYIIRKRLQAATEFQDKTVAD